MCLFSLCFSSSPRGPSTSPSAHSISTPEKNRFPRGTTSRSTFHGAQLRDRRSATYNGPPASPTLSHDTGALTQQRRGTSTGIISKITSKFVRRSVTTKDSQRIRYVEVPAHSSSSTSCKIRVWQTFGLVCSLKKFFPTLCTWHERTMVLF